jgi:ribosomal protein S18 acetylase RimI-like enzyme
VLDRIEAYYDAAPRSAARTEEIGPFTLFVGEGPWPYYARPRLGATEFTADEVAVVRARQRELGVPEAFEWVHETTPGLLEVVDMDVLQAPLMVLEAFNEATAPPSIDVRILTPDDEALAASIAVANVGFSAAGTAPGPQGIAERDAALPRDDLGFRRERLRRRFTVTAVAENAAGPVAVGSHNPVGDVTEVVGVATLPAVRRQGLGAAVTSALVEDALAGGAEVVFLSAGSEDIARVYQRLGFRRIGTACIAG